jgi:hypothetical protein
MGDTVGKLHSVGAAAGELSRDLDVVKNKRDLNDVWRFQTTVVQTDGRSAQGGVVDENLQN